MKSKLIILAAVTFLLCLLSCDIKKEEKVVANEVNRLSAADSQKLIDFAKSANADISWLDKLEQKSKQLSSLFSLDVQNIVTANQKIAVSGFIKDVYIINNETFLVLESPQPMTAIKKLTFILKCSKPQATTILNQPERGAVKAVVAAKIDGNVRKLNLEVTPLQHSSKEDVFMAIETSDPKIFIINGQCLELKTN